MPYQFCWGTGISTSVQSATKLYWRNQKSLTCQLKTVFVVIPVAHGGTYHVPISHRMLQNHWNHGCVIAVWLMLQTVTLTVIVILMMCTPLVLLVTLKWIPDSVNATVDNAVQTNSRFHVLADPVVSCSVCSSQSIPVGEGHICTICYKPVHAWCSNHEDITRSLDLVCKQCQP